MAVRQIIKIDESKCTGCGLCVKACHEGAIGLVDGKAKLLRDDYCDGLGDCLPRCPVDAISFIQKDTLAYDEEAVKKHKEENKIFSSNSKGHCDSSSCPGSKERVFKRVSIEEEIASIRELPTNSELGQWPCQIKLVSPGANFLKDCHLLIAADCTAYSYARFHQDFMKGKVTIIGCPKLDHEDYSDRLSEIFKYNNIRSITFVRMEVPCCGGLEQAMLKALEISKKHIPYQIFTISTSGEIL